MTFQMGTANHNKGGFDKANWFYIKSEFDKGGVKGGNNIFRVIPPVHSLAATGAYYQYLSVHKNVIDSKGHAKSFLCIEDRDFKTKITKVHCPYCDKAAFAQQQYELAKGKGATPEQLSDFKKAHIDPYIPERNYWINVLDQSNAVGRLGLKSELFKSFRTLCQTYAEKGVDITGIKGFYVNFQKISAYKGDKQVVYKADIYRETVHDPATGEMNEKPKMHIITEEIIQKIAKESADLPNLFKRIKPEQIQMLADCKDPEQKKLLVDQIWSTGEKKEEKAADPLSQRVGNTDVNLVGTVGVDHTGLTSTMPDLNDMKADAPIPDVMLNTTTSVEDPFAGFNQATTTAAATPATATNVMSGVPSEGMSDEEFMAAFGGALT